ncbi:MAG: hypothetical protein HQM16_16340 [Deltaproteobacteria bacterium]|nr:hypothetical protein [Deltaproteobacteria bacterium]
MKDNDKIAFFVMPFQKPDIDDVWDKVYKPVVNSLGFEAVRIDERDDGKIKLDQICNFLSTADLVIGDLTYKRPNCYFEIGYAMAIRKEYVLILCAQKGQRVHFDLAAYDVMRWDPKNLGDFRQKFQHRLQERKDMIAERTQIPETTKIISNPKIKRSHIDLEALAAQIRKGLVYS